MTDERRFHTQIPNIIDDLGLNPYERALYVHYKRVCGASGGQCTEGVRGTAERTKISVGKVAPTRKALIDRGLIVGDIHHGKDTTITIVDIWDINAAYYDNKNRPNIDGWTVTQLKKWATNCSRGEQLDGNSSYSEQNCSGDEQNCSPREQKKEPIKKEPSKKLLSKDNGGEPPVVDEPPASRENETETETLYADTPETRLLFAKINHNRQLIGRNQVKRFKSLEQKQKCLKAAVRLGYQKFSEGVEAGLQTGLPAELNPLVNWIAKYSGNGVKNGTHSQDSRKVNPKRGTGHDLKAEPTFNPFTGETVYPDGRVVPGLSGEGVSSG